MMYTRYKKKDIPAFAPVFFPAERCPRAQRGKSETLQARHGSRVVSSAQMWSSVKLLFYFIFASSLLAHLLRKNTDSQRHINPARDGSSYFLHSNRTLTRPCFVECDCLWLYMCGMCVNFHAYLSSFLSFQILSRFLW